MTKYIPKKPKEIYTKVATDLDITVEEVDDVITSVWSAVAKFIAEDPFNAIYLRHLGTFYGRTDIAYMIEQAKKKNKKNEKSSREL